MTAEGPFKGTFITVGTPTTIHGVLEFHSGTIVTIGASWDVQPRPPISSSTARRAPSMPDPNFFGGNVVVTDQASQDHGRAVDHPFGWSTRPAATAWRAPITARRAGHMIASTSQPAGALRLDVALHAVDVMTSLLKAGEAGAVVTLTTTCERPAALRPEDARALLK